jgi:hypothetical protein
MSLKVVHIDSKKVQLEAEAYKFWKEVLEPKWRERDRKAAYKFFGRPDPEEGKAKTDGRA